MAERIPSNEEELKRWSPKGDHKNADGGIDYTAEGATPGDREPSDTDRGYDEAAHSGPSRYGTPEGAGGVFGTTGGGTFGRGFRAVEHPALDPNFGDRDIDATDRESSIDREEAEGTSQLDIDRGGNLGR